VHLPVARHREAWAVEATAPHTKPPAASQANPGVAPEARSRRRLVRPEARKSKEKDVAREVLIVASRLKDYVRARAGYNTSDGVLEPLSEIVRTICDEAIRNARREGRKTVLDRDLPRGR